MTHFKSNLRDIEFNLFEVFGRQRLLGSAPHDELDEETAQEDSRRGRAAGDRADRGVVH